jgi:hypothetical protein
MIPSASPTAKNVPLKIVGGNNFGRYSKISIEETYNMIVSDNWLVPYAGYKTVTQIEETARGRAIFNSIPLGKMIVVIDNNVYLIDKNLSHNKLASIETYSEDISIAENNKKQIAICDQKDIYIYDYENNVFDKARTEGSPLDFRPNYVAFQDGYFIAATADRAEWRLSEINNGFNFPALPNNVGKFESKGDFAKAVIPIPGKGNQLLVMGNSVTLHWVDVGYKLFPYQQTSSVNIDYGCTSASTIAFGDTFVVWLAVNEKSGPVIMLSDGVSIKPISNEGINFKLAQISNPENAYGFLFKQDGHLFYQLTFPADNITYTYDFNTKQFYTLSDQYTNHHIAKRLAAFNNSYYFISFKDGNLYELNSKYTTFDDKEIVRIRICPNIRLPDGSPFIVDFLTFTIEQGNADSDMRVDISISRDGGISFGSYHAIELQELGLRKYRANVFQLGYANDFIVQLRFWGKDRFVITDGYVRVYQ